MIEKLTIRNFKSIKELELDCGRVNLFIGEPNAGKSNILEALGLLSWCGSSAADKRNMLPSFVRYKNFQNVFYDELLDRPLEIKTDGSPKTHLKVSFNDDNFNCALLSPDGKVIPDKQWIFSYSGSPDSWSPLPEFETIKFYRFINLDEFDEKRSSYLLPPQGQNLFSVVMAHEKLRKTMSRFFKDYGFKLVFRPQEKVFEIQKQQDDVVFTYPYAVISDTLRHMIFNYIAIESNKNSTLIFEEPESHAFPYYTKQLGEKIAFDESNQYFIATHNPYLLRPIVEKGKKEEINVFVTYFEDYETKVKPLSGNQLSELIDFDPFFNLKSFISDKSIESDV